MKATSTHQDTQRPGDFRAGVPFTPARRMILPLAVMVVALIMLVLAALSIGAGMLLHAVVPSLDIAPAMGMGTAIAIAALHFFERLTRPRPLPVEEEADATTGTQPAPGAPDDLDTPQGAGRAPKRSPRKPRYRLR